MITKDLGVDQNRNVINCSSEHGVEIFGGFIEYDRSLATVSCAQSPVTVKLEPMYTTAARPTGATVAPCGTKLYSWAAWAGYPIHYASVGLNTRSSDDFTGRACVTSIIQFVLMQDMFWTPVVYAISGTCDEYYPAPPN